MVSACSYIAARPDGFIYTYVQAVGFVLFMCVREKSL